MADIALLILVGAIVFWLAVNGAFLYWMWRKSPYRLWQSWMSNPYRWFPGNRKS